MNRQSRFAFPFPLDTTYSHRNSHYHHPDHQQQQHHYYHTGEMDPNAKVGVWMNISDPTGEFMYQMPPAGVGGDMGRKGDAATEGSQLE